MTYLYRRSTNLVDLLIAKPFRKVLTVKDGVSEGGVFRVILQGLSFDAQDPNPAADSSAAIATQLAALINAETSLGITATPTGPEIELIPQDEYDFSVEVWVTDPQGAIVVRDAPPEAYEVYTAANWDQAFVTLVDTVPSQGKVSASATSDFVDFMGARQRYVRWVMRPSDYGLVDNQVLFLQTTPIVGGLSGSPSPIKIVMTPQQGADSHTVLTLSGVAPVAADSASALALDLPRQTASYVIANEGANPLVVTLTSAPSELIIAPGIAFRDNRGAISHIRVRGQGGPTQVSMYFTLATQRAL